MKNKIILILMLISEIALSNTEVKPELKFPKIVGWQSAPLVELANSARVVLKKDQILKNAFAVITTNSDQLDLEFAQNESVQVLPKSRIQIPEVIADTALVSELFIFDGAIRFKTMNVKEEQTRLHIKSAFFDLALPKNLDVVITIDKKAAFAKFEVMQGQMTAVFLDYEKTEVLKAGESLVYQGENDEEGKLRYDYFLGSKRMPHGTMKPKETFDAATIIKKEAEFLKQIQIDEEKKKKAALVLKKKKQKIVESFLCHDPFGQQDQCYWKLEQSKCFRYRCNVSGQWGDRTERPVIDKCSLKPAVNSCDF